MLIRRFLTIIISSALCLLPAAPLAQAESITKGQPVAPFTALIKSGQYVWHPEISPAGPVVIIVSLPEQVLYVYRNGVRIGRSTISSGKAGHRAPTGVFTILQKNVKHISTIYKGASMPHMERLTWGGVAIHAGDLPGYPAAHGCVRLPMDFARQLYAVTSNGTTVIVAGQKPKTGNTPAPGLLFDTTPSEVTPPGGIVWNPEKAPTGPVSVIVSSADGVAWPAIDDGMPRLRRPASLFARVRDLPGNNGGPDGVPHPVRTQGGSPWG